MRVVALSNEFGQELFGGAGTAATGMLRTLASAGVQVTVVVPGDESAGPRRIQATEQLRVLSVPRRHPYFGALGMVDAERVLSEFPELCGLWDLIHIQAINFAPMAQRLAARQIPLLYSVYSLLRDDLDDDGHPDLRAQFAVQDQLLLKAQVIHLISESQRTRLAGYLPECSSRVRVVPLGISWPAGPSWHGMDSGSFLYVGRLIYHKGVEDLLRAFHLLKQEGRIYPLDIVGKGPDYYEERLSFLVRNWQLGAQVNFRGWAPGAGDIRQWMERSRALVMPSHREAFGLVALEGMATGIPLIASQSGGLAELVDRTTALVFPAGDCGQLAAHLHRAMGNPVLCARLAERAHARAQTLRWEQLVDPYLHLYRFSMNDAR